MVELREYQKNIVRVEMERKNVLIVAPMGAGKTLATLTATAALIVREGLKNILIIAPKRVASSVWSQEAATFNMGLNVRYCEKALDVKLFLVSPEPHKVCVCSVTRIKEIPHGCWDCVIIDESTLMKHKQSLRSKEARRICNKVPHRILLSGTPVHNGYIGLWHQCFLLDGGAALGRTLGEFYRRYCRVKYKVNGVVSIYEVDPAQVDQLMSDCRHLVYIVKNSVALPECLYKNVYIDLPKRRMTEYKTFEETNVLAFEKENGGKPYGGDEKTFLAFSRTSLGMKLRQFASGCVYLDDTNETYDVVHTEKIEALKDLRESYDGGLLVAYGFKSEYEELKKAFPTARRLDTPQDIADWNARKIGMALVHPASVGHGLNLQFGGSVVVWYSLTYDAELYAQLNKRLHRSGQKETVSIIHLIARGTIDEKVLKILQRKESDAETFYTSM